MNRIRNQRGAALLETAITLPIILLVCIGIFEFGRAYQTWQVLTNAAREGARVAILAETTDAKVSEVVTEYLKAGELEHFAKASILVERTVPFGSNTASRVTVTYPFDFKWLYPAMRLVKAGSDPESETRLMQSSALMRNEG